MDLKSFLTELLAALANIDIIKDIDLKSEGITLSGRIILSDKMFMEVYHNEVTATTAFALIKEGKRIWGIDKDSVRNWHIHPLNNPEQHEPIQSMAIFDIIECLKNVLDSLMAEDALK